jgi:hypothetical protein
VIARYVFARRDQTLYYGEMPLNAVTNAAASEPSGGSLLPGAGNSNPVDRFIDMDPRGRNDFVSFYPVKDVSDFSLVYVEDPAKKEQSGALGGQPPAPAPGSVVVGAPAPQQRTPGKGSERGWSGDPSPLAHIVVRITLSGAGAPVKRLLFPEFLSFRADIGNAGK